MDKQLAIIQKNVYNLCHYTRTVHVEEWKTLIQESKPIFEIIRNLSDQLKHANQADLYEWSKFERLKLSIQSNILDQMQDEFLKLRELLDRVSKSNQEVKNKLEAVFKSTLDLDWTENNSLINGTARQPALSLILSRGMKYWKFYNNVCSNIKLQMKCFHPFNETSMNNFFNSYNIIHDEHVSHYICLIEYVDTEIPKCKNKVT